MSGHSVFSHVDVRVIDWVQLQDVLPVPGNFTAVHLPHQYRQVLRALQYREEQVQASASAALEVESLGGSPRVYGGGRRSPVSPPSAPAPQRMPDPKCTPVKRGPSAAAARAVVLVCTRGQQEQWHAMPRIVVGPRSGVVSVEVRGTIRAPRRQVGEQRAVHERESQDELEPGVGGGLNSHSHDDAEAVGVVAPPKDD